MVEQNGCDNPSLGQHVLGGCKIEAFLLAEFLDWFLGNLPGQGRPSKSHPILMHLGPG